MNTTDTTGTGSFDSSLVLVLATATGSSAPGAYGLLVPDVGEVYGANENVFAVRGYQEFKFEVKDGMYCVFHVLYNPLPLAPAPCTIPALVVCVMCPWLVAAGR